VTVSSNNNHHTPGS